MNMSAKLNNNRKFPGATRQPCQDDKFRKDEAKERQAYYDTLTPQQKLEALDSKLGKGVGAVRQRQKLNALLLKLQ